MQPVTGPMQLQTVSDTAWPTCYCQVIASRAITAINKQMQTAQLLQSGLEFLCQLSVLVKHWPTAWQKAFSTVIPDFVVHDYVVSFLFWTTWWHYPQQTEFYAMSLRLMTSTVTCCCWLLLLQADHLHIGARRSITAKMLQLRDCRATMSAGVIVSTTCCILHNRRISA